jgi:tetratricopeptide (TPR) repeat protein
VPRTPVSPDQHFVDATERFQRWVLFAVVPLATLLFWTRTPDAAGLLKATVLWLAAIVAGGIGLLRLVRTGRASVRTGPVPLALAALALALVLSWFVSDWRTLSFIGEYTRYSGLASYLAGIVLALTAARVLGPREAGTIARIVVGTLAVVLLYGVLQLLDVEPIDWKAQGFGQVFSTLGNSNFFAGFIGVATPFAAWLGVSEGVRSWPGRIAWLLVVVAIVCAAGSQSFQGPAAVAAGLLVFALVVVADRREVARSTWAAWPAGRRRGAVVAAVIALAALVAVAVVTVPNGVSTGLVERRSFWRAALEMFGDAPILGQGLDTYGQLFLQFRPRAHGAEYAFNHAEAAHSVPLHLLAGGGVVLLAAWLALVVATGFVLVRGLRTQAGERRLLLGAVGAAWVAYLVQAAVSLDVPTLLLLHFLVTGMIVALAEPGSRARTFSGAPKAAAQAVGVAGLVALVIGLWFSFRPLRADLAAGAAVRASNAGDNVAAMADAERATDLAPWQGRHWVIRAQVLERAQEVFASADAAVEATEREPGSAQYALLAGRLLERYRSREQAAPFFEEAAERDPNNAIVLAELATFVVEDDPERALELAERARAISDISNEPLLAIGAAHRAAGDLEEAREAYALVREREPGNVEAANALTEIDAELAQPSER